MVLNALITLGSDQMCVALIGVNFDNEGTLRCRSA